MARATKPTSVLFVGNSYTDRNNLPGLLERLASAGRPAKQFVTERVIANGMSLKTHWDRGIAGDSIRKQRWDYVVLQDQSTMGLKNPARLKEYAAKFNELCKANGARSALYLTWARKDASNRQAEITAAYTEAAQAIDAVLIPVGTAWQHSLQQHPELVLHDRDNSHPSLMGTYLAACVFYGTLVGRTPVGLPTEAIPAVAATALQQVAWTTCIETQPAGIE